jgi:hypothetical protein
MPQHSDNWLLDPVFPAPAALPRLDDATEELARLDVEPNSEVHHPSGTWRVALGSDERALVAHATDDARERRSSADAPTVRPGSLHALKTG